MNLAGSFREQSLVSVMKSKDNAEMLTVAGEQDIYGGA